MSQIRKMSREPSRETCDSACLGTLSFDVTNRRCRHRPLTLCQLHTENTHSGRNSQDSSRISYTCAHMYICVGMWWENICSWFCLCQKGAFILHWGLEDTSGSCQRLHCALNLPPPPKHTHTHACKHLHTNREVALTISTAFSKIFQQMHIFHCSHTVNTSAHNIWLFQWGES